MNEEIMSALQSMESQREELVQSTVNQPDSSKASGLLRIIAEMYKEYSNKLSLNEDLLIIASTNNGESVVVNRIRHRDPHILIMEGANTAGRKSTVIAHQNSLQLQFLVINLEPNIPKNKIGFDVEDINKGELS